jgi:ligand-binding sensor domain-containing protein/signal transduction histidine kinase
MFFVSKAKTILFTLVLCTFVKYGQVYAQYGSLAFRHLTTKSGLPHEYLFYSVIQDSRGFMWFGSENGLHRYDGYEFTNYYHDPDDAASINGNAVFYLMEDFDKNLWIATNKGVNIYDWKSNSFKKISFLLSEDSLQNPNNYYSTYLLQAQNGNIYLSTNNFLYQYDTKRKVFAPFTVMQNFPEANGFVAIRTMGEDINGNIWLSTQESGLYFLDLESKKIVEFSEKGEHPFKILSNNTFSVFIDASHEVWVASDKGLNRIDINYNKNTTYAHDPKNPASLSYNFVNYIYEDDLKNLWISTDGGGLNLFDRKSNGFTHYQHNQDDETSLLGDKTNLIYKNRQDLLWVAAIGRGLNYTNLKNAGSFKTHTSLSSAGNVLSNNAVTSIIEGGSGDLWIGTDGGGLVHYNTINDRFEQYKNRKNDPNTLPSNSVTSLYMDNNGELWVGTFHGGLSKFNKSNKTFTNYLSGSGHPELLSGYSIFAIYEDKSGNILAGGHNSGINILDRKTNTIKHIYNNPDNNNSLSSNYILTFYTDFQNMIWIGTYHGLSRWDPKTNMFINYYQNDFDKNSLSHNWVYSITEDSKNNLWIGTASGLNLFNRETQKFESFSRKDGFVNDVINGIIEDKKGNLWMSTNGGLVIFNPENKEVKNFDISNGLPGNEFMKCAYYKGKNDVLYFGNTKGLVYFSPEDIKTNTFVPPVHITDFNIQNNPVPIGKDGSPLQKHIIETEEIVLKYDQTYITFKYAALNYESPEKNQYAYMLEGFDKDWHYVGNERKATYTSLKAGEYTFRVKGSNNDGIWNEEGASVRIVVLPPWWKTWWFKAMSFLFIISCLFVVYYLRISSLRRQKLVLENRVFKRTEELNKTNTALEIQSENLKMTNELLIEKQKLIEAQKGELLHSNEQLSLLNATKDKLFSVLGHDLKSPFNHILGFGELLMKNIEDYPLDKIKRNVKYMIDGTHMAYDLLENLLNWSLSQRGALKVCATQVNIKQMLEDTLRVLKQQAKTKHITINTEIKGNKEVVHVDDVLLGTVIRNIVSNSIKFSNKNSQIQINALIEGDVAKFTISDQGVGIPDEVKENLFKVSNVASTAGTGGEKGTGLGLLVCAEFVQLLKGKIWVESKLNAGTTFFIEVPV